MTSPNAERRQAAILYLELRNFTRLSEAFEPAKVLQLANEFFGLAALCMGMKGGKVVTVHNDALLGTFGGSKPSDYCMRALEAAQLLQRDFPMVGERWKNEYGLPAAVAAGLHVGETVFGMGGPTGQQHAIAFGDCVSVAERLVHRARSGEIVISQDLMKALGAGAKKAQAVELPALQLYKRDAIPLYAIVLETRLDFT